MEQGSISLTGLIVLVVCYFSYILFMVRRSNCIPMNFWYRLFTLYKFMIMRGEMDVVSFPRFFVLL